MAGKDRKEKALLILTGIAAVAVMLFTELCLKPGYLVKSLIKASAFLGAALLYAFFSKKNLAELLHLKPLKNGKAVLLLAAGTLFAILLLFFILRNRFDLAQIRTRLTAKEGLTQGNCIFVFLYIAFVNSFLEEAFFRGLLFRGLGGQGSMAYLVSGLLFAVYHVGILDSWFAPWIFVLMIAGLFSCGVMFDRLTVRHGSLLGSWIVHFSANLAIDLIGAYLMFCL